MEYVSEDDHDIPKILTGYLVIKLMSHLDTH